MIENILFTANTVAPVFIIIALGYLCRITGIINDNFVNTTSKFVFNISLPVFIFMKVIDLDLSRAIATAVIIYVYIAVILSFGLLYFFASFLIKDGKDRASFIQGSFKANFAIIGLAIISNLYGKEVLGEATIILAFIIPLYNILAVISLTFPLHKEKRVSLLSMVINTIFNPLVLGVILGLPFAFTGRGLPQVAMVSGRFLSDIALPLALIGIGGSLNFENIKKASGLAILSSIIKLVISPLVFTSGAYIIGFRGEELGLILVLFSCPTAIVSFIMARAMGANAKLAGNIVVISTLFSIISISTGIIILKGLGLI